MDLFFNCSGVLDAVFVQLNIRLQFLLDSIAFYSHFSQDGLCLQREIRHVIPCTLQIIQGKIDRLLTDGRKNRHTDKTTKERDTLISRLRTVERSTATDLHYARNRKKRLSPLQWLPLGIQKNNKNKMN